MKRRLQCQKEICKRHVSDPNFLVYCPRFTHADSDGVDTSAIASSFNNDENRLSKITPAEIQFN